MIIIIIIKDVFTKFQHSQVKKNYFSGICKEVQGGIGSLLWSGYHIDGHGWKWVIVPSDLMQSFRAMWAYDLVHAGKATHACLVGLDTKKSGGTITLLHKWQQDGCCNRFSLEFPWVFVLKERLYVHIWSPKCYAQLETFFFFFFLLDPIIIVTRKKNTNN